MIIDEFTLYICFWIFFYYPIKDNNQVSNTSSWEPLVTCSNQSFFPSNDWNHLSTTILSSY